MFRITIAWIWLFHIVLTTLGLPVHRIYCACTGQVAVTLISNARHDCDAQTSSTLASEVSCCAEPTTQTTQASCCAPKPAVQASCCSPNLTDAAPDGICAATDNCMDDDVFIIQLDTDLLCKDLVKTPTLDPHGMPEAHIFFYPVQPTQADSLVPVSFRGPPMRPYGRWLLPHIQSWLC
jgi:hypothetical protein